METTLIVNSQKQLTEHFKSFEFWSGTDFYLPNCLPTAAQIIRDYFSVPIFVTSVYRHNDTFGYHRYGQAIDMISANHDFNLQKNFRIALLSKQSTLFNELRNTGITGFGLELNCVHLDCRSNVLFSQHDVFGGFTIFEWHREPLPFGSSEIVYR